MCIYYYYSSGVGSHDIGKSFNDDDVDNWLYSMSPLGNSNEKMTEFSEDSDSFSDEDDYDNDSTYSDSDCDEFPDSEDYSDIGTKYTCHPHYSGAPVFDIRIIDFANASFDNNRESDTDEDFNHSNNEFQKCTNDLAPDNGFLTGLRTILHILNDMLKHNRLYNEDVQQYV